MALDLILGAMRKECHLFLGADFPIVKGSFPREVLDNHCNQLLLSPFLLEAGPETNSWGLSVLALNYLLQKREITLSTNTVLVSSVSLLLSLQCLSTDTESSL